MNEEDLICPITLELLSDPISVPCCGVSFSRLSLINIFENNRQMCPNCRKELNYFDPKIAPKNIVIDKILAIHKEKKIPLCLQALNQKQIKSQIKELNKKIFLPNKSLSNFKQTLLKLLHEELTELLPLKEQIIETQTYLAQLIKELKGC